MPSLNWIGKERIENHDKEVAFRLLKKDAKLSLGKSSENLIVEGDNLEALKALMPHYAGKVKCIYIDPPYNTGNEGWVYNDKVNSPQIKEWLNKAVGPEGEDLTRHDKWLCMMYPRLKLLRDLLKPDGVIFISIDDNEHCYLKLMMDEIFGPENFVANIVWQKKYSPQNDAKYFSDMHDFIIVYAKKKNYGSETKGWIRNLVLRTKEQDARYKNPDNDIRGPWKPADLSVKTYSANYDYPIKTPSGRTVNPPKSRAWATSKEGLESWKNDNRIWFGKDGNNIPSVKIFLSEVQAGTVPLTIWLRDEVGDNQEAKQELKAIFNTEQFPFDTPKPVRLIKRILQIATNEDDLILDSFAGSGTTAHAVLQLNKEETGSRRKFILVEMEAKIARTITSERVRRVAKSLGGDFEYVTLGETLFESSGAINQKVSFNDLASYVYFTETHTNLNQKKIKNNFIGEYGGREYYLLFKDKDTNVLSRATLSKLGKSKLPKVVYADKCLIDQSVLDKHKVTFKQIPYSVKTY